MSECSIELLPPGQTQPGRFTRAICVLSLPAALLLFTGIILQLSWRTAGTMRPGETRTLHSSNDAVIHVADPKHHPKEYYLWDKLAPRVRASSVVVATGGLEVIDAKTEITPKTVEWTDGGRTRTTHHAPGAQVDISATVRAPLSASGAGAITAEWRSPALNDDPDYRHGLEFENMNGSRRSDEGLLLGEFMLGQGAAYWEHCLRKAFFAAVPFALGACSAVCFFLLGRIPRTEYIPVSPQGALLFPGDYFVVRYYFGNIALLSGPLSMILVGMTLEPSPGEMHEEHVGFFLISIACYLLPALAAMLARRHKVKRVELSGHGMLVDGGEGWGPTLDLPWSAITKVTPMTETTLIKRDTQRYLRIERAQGEPFEIREYGVHYYDTLCEKALAHFAQHHPAEAAAPPPAG